MNTQWIFENYQGNIVNVFGVIMAHSDCALHVVRRPLEFLRHLQGIQ